MSSFFMHCRHIAPTFFMLVKFENDSSSCLDNDRFMYIGNIQCSIRIVNEYFYIFYISYKNDDYKIMLLLPYLCNMIHQSLVYWPMTILGMTPLPSGKSMEYSFPLTFVMNFPIRSDLSNRTLKLKAVSIGVVVASLPCAN